jgi:hypothetical protein
MLLGDFQITANLLFAVTANVVLIQCLAVGLAHQKLHPRRNCHVFLGGDTASPALSGKRVSWYYEFAIGARGSRQRF